MKLSPMQRDLYCKNCAHVMSIIEDSPRKYKTWWAECKNCGHKVIAERCPKCRCFYIDDTNVQSINKDNECLRCDHISGDIMFNYMEEQNDD